jgi:hypothetical protein
MEALASHLPKWPGIDIRSPTAAPIPAVAGAPALPAIPTQLTGTNFMGVQLAYPAWAPSITQYGGLISSLFYGSILFFVLFLVLVFIHFTVYPIFSFSPNDDGIIPIPTISDRQIAFTKSPAASDLSANFIDVPACTYTVGMDVFLSGNFQASNLPRVLLYRAIGSNVSPPQTDRVANLVSRFPDSNILVWLDAMKNDLMVSIVTSSDGTATTRKLETTEAVENVPVKKVFRVTVVYTQQFVEIYINGKLEKSMALKNSPITVSNKAAFFPVISSIGPNVLISNLAFWSRALSAREVRAYGAPISNDAFFSKSAF